MIPVTWAEVVLSFWRPGRSAPPRLSCGGAQDESGGLARLADMQNLGLQVTVQQLTRKLGSFLSSTRYWSLGLMITKKQKLEQSMAAIHPTSRKRN